MFPQPFEVLDPDSRFEAPASRYASLPTLLDGQVQKDGDVGLRDPLVEHVVNRHEHVKISSSQIHVCEYQVLRRGEIGNDVSCLQLIELVIVNEDEGQFGLKSESLRVRIELSDERMLECLLLDVRE